MWIMHTAVYLPSLLALLYGVVLCFRHVHHKPQTVLRSGTAIALLAGSAAPSMAMMFASWLGIPLTWGGLPVPFVFTLLQSVLFALGLGLLLRTAYFDETSLEFDDSPPVYRNDDGPTANA